MYRNHSSQSSCEQSSDRSASTVDVIREICDQACQPCQPQKPVHRPIRIESGCSTWDNGQPRGGSIRCDPGTFTFTSIIVPISGLTPGYSNCGGTVEFRMRRKNKTVTLQWEPFTGAIGESGIAFVTVIQSIANTPPYPISIPISLQYKGTIRTTRIEIDPHAKSNIKFYLNSDGSATDINLGDSLSVPGGCVSWIVD